MSNIVSESKVCEWLGICSDELKNIPESELRRLSLRGHDCFYYENDIQNYVKNHKLERRVSDLQMKKMRDDIKAKYGISHSVPETTIIRGESAETYVNRCKQVFADAIVKMGVSRGVVESAFNRSKPFRMVWNGWDKSEYKNISYGIL